MRTTITGEKWLRDANLNMSFSFDGTVNVNVNTESVLTVEEKNYPTPDKNFYQNLDSTTVIDLIDEAGISTGKTITVVELATIARSVRAYCAAKAIPVNPNGRI